MPTKTLARIIPGIAIGAVAIWLYADTFKELFASWMRDGNYAHGILVIPVSLLLVYMKRKELAQTPICPSAAGNLLLGAGVIVFAFSRWSDVTFLAGISIVLVAAGLVWTFAGYRMLREVAFPLVFLIFMTPPPDFFVEKIGAPLQRASCSYAAMLGGIMGMDVESQGVMLLANGMTFEVALPCSGIRAINALSAFSAVLAYMARTSIIGRITIFLAALPLAFAANVLRVFVVIAVANIDSVKTDVMRFHDASGPIIFLIALAIVLLVKRRFECSWRDDTCPSS